MTRAACTTPVSELLAYWLGEVDAADEARIDEHLFGCAACAARLRALVALGAAIRRETLRGDFGFIASAAFVRRLQDAGLKVREYALEPGGSVACTITPEDDFVVSHLRAPLGGVQRLDVLIDDSSTGPHRVSDVTFDAAAGELTYVPSATFLRTLRHAQQRVRLVAVDGADERVVADYTFNHYPT